MATIKLQFSNTFKWAESSITGRAYVGTSLAEIHSEMSELLVKQVNAQM